MKRYISRQAVLLAIKSRLVLQVHPYKFMYGKGGRMIVTFADASSISVLSNV